MKIMTQDPRHNPAFLQLSDSVIRAQSYSASAAQWGDIADACRRYFQRYGYDLQSGTWFMQAAFYRHGWQGMAEGLSSLSAALEHDEECWPPRSLESFRHGLLQWFCQHVLSLVYVTPITAEEGPVLAQVEEGFNALIHLAQGSEGKEQAEMLKNAQFFLAVQRRALVPVAPQPVCSEAAPVSLLPVSPSSVRPAWRTLAVGFVAGTILTSLVAGGVWLKRPSLTTEQRVENLLGTSAVTRWQEGVTLSQQIKSESERQRWEQHLQYLTTQAGDISTWQRALARLDALEARLLDAERKQARYLTISELKTEIYQLRQLLKDGMPAEAMLYGMEMHPQSVSEIEKQAFEQRVDALISRYVANEQSVNLLIRKR